MFPSVVQGFPSFPFLEPSNVATVMEATGKLQLLKGKPSDPCGFTAAVALGCGLRDQPRALRGLSLHALKCTAFS